MAEDPKFFPAPTDAARQIARARLGILKGNNENVADGEWIYVHFNPASLQLQISNELKDNKNQQRSQYIAKTSAKLTMELQFDCTDQGKNVTEDTRKLQAFVVPPVPPSSSSAGTPSGPPPPSVMFEWGALKFKGIAENYNETIDFFSAEGVPLRSLVKLTLTRQDRVFDDAPEGAANSSSVEAPANSPSDAAKAAGDPGGARAVAAANGEENLRFGSGAALTVSGGVELKPAVAFASASAGFGAGAGIGIGGGLGVGGGIGVSGGLSVGGGAGISGGFSAGASAGVSGGVGFSATGGVSVGIAERARLSASEGAFAGLSVTARPSTPRLDPSRLITGPGSARLATTGVQASGKATIEGAAGLRADVGGLGSKLQFDVS
jgi:hypothetical protein